MCHPIVPRLGTVAVIFDAQLRAVGKYFISFFESSDGLGDHLIITFVVHRNPVAVINALSLRPDLFARKILGVVPADEINSAAGVAFIDERDRIVSVPLQR